MKQTTFGGFELMAILETYLQENFLAISQPQHSDPLTLEQYHQQHEAALSIGFDFESRTYFLKSDPRIALIPIIGATSKFGGWTSTGTQMLSMLLANAKKSDKYKAAMLYIDSPGGAVDGTAEWSDEIKNAGIPTMAFIDGMGASAGYWQAISADQVFANRMNANIIGSIGVQTMHVDRREAAKATIGDVKIIRARQSTLKNTVNSFEPLSKEGEAWIIDRLSETADQFITYVKSRRPGIKEDSSAFAGDVFTGEQALEAGMIDGLITFQEAVDMLASKITTKSTKINNSNSNTTAMKFQSSFKAILAALGFSAVASEEEAPLVTEERLEALNASLDSANQTIGSKEAEITQLKADLQAAKDAQSTAETDRDAWKAKAEKFAKGPGASHFVLNQGKAEGGNEDLTAEQQAQALIDALPHNKALEGNPLFN
jgi:ClpP class serine protease